jgi:hypothetical protein
MLHKDARLGFRHPVHNWEPADSTALAAIVPAGPEDIGKLALQLDTKDLYALVDDSPATWVLLSLQASDSPVLSVNGQTGSVILTVDELGDVDVSGGLSVGDILVWDGADWIPQAPSAAGNLSDLDDVDAASPNDGQVLTWDDGTSTWIAADPAGGVSLTTNMGSTATTSGTTKTITGIPSSAVRFTLFLKGVQSAGSSGFTVKVGPVTGVVSTGYSGGYGFVAGGGGSNASSNSTAIILGGAAGAPMDGQIEFTCIDAVNYVYHFRASAFRANAEIINQGYITLTGPLERAQILTANGSDTFNAGAIYGQYNT